MALTIDQETAAMPPDSKPQNGQCSTTDRSLAEFQASMTALAIIDAFARVAAHRAVADANSIPRGKTERR